MHIQRIGAIGIGVEAVAGTAVSATQWFQPTKAPSIGDKYEYDPIKSARGRVEESQGQTLKTVHGEGNIEVIFDDTQSVIPMGLILGSVNSASAGAGKYEHTITVNNTNTPKTATLSFDRVVDIRKFPNAVIEKLDLKVSDGFAEMTMGYKSRESSAGAAVDTYTALNTFTFKDLTVKFGVDVSEATAATPTPLSGVDLSIKRTAALNYATGQNYPQSVGQTTISTSGNYSLLFEGVTERDKYLSNTKNAMILTFTNGANSVVITLPNVMISDWKASNDLDKEVSQTSDFTAHLDPTTNESIRVVVKNTTATYLNLS